jgi:hypothetical protein
MEGQELPGRIQEGMTMSWGGSWLPEGALSVGRPSCPGSISPVGLGVRQVRPHREEM